MTRHTTRRDFLKTSAAATAAVLAAAPAVHAAAGDVLKVGLVGCGGRGTGAAAQALSADSNVKLVAVGDLFKDRLDGCLSGLRSDKAIAPKVAVTPDTSFVGFDAYKQVIAAADVVLLCTPPHFRPAHIKAAVEAGKHVFAEKPVAVDAPGVRSVLASAALAKQKGLSLVSGFCWRYHAGMRSGIARVHDRTIGDIVTLQCTYNTGSLWHRSLKEKQTRGWSDMEWQLRNWLYFTWLSGDFIVEQHVHSLDKMAWVMHNEPPVRATATGGRQVRTEPDFGHVFDHFAVVYEYAGGARCFSMCRQQAGCANDVSDHVWGTRGVCDILASRSEVVIRPHGGGEAWKSDRNVKDMYQAEHDELFAGIRAGKPINDGEWMAKSSMMAILGRMAAYTGQQITWDKAFNSAEDLTPARYEFGPAEVPPVARPGFTKFV